MNEYLCDENGQPYDAETFDLDAYLDRINPRMLETSEGRRVLTRLDPMLFGLLYLPHHMKGKQTGDRITFADCHLDWARMAREWVCPITEPRTGRHVFISPRESAKSTWWFLIIPMWAAAHGFARFIAAFSDSATQAETHLATFKVELDGNQLLRQDYPELTMPATRGRGTVVADRQSQLQTASGFTFAARGIDSGNLGLKVGQQRPDVLIADDIESGEANYSVHQAKKRLSTLQNVILPLSEFARAVVVGTTTMAGGLIHQCVKTVTTSEEPAGWIQEENFQVHYYSPIVKTTDGRERSIWPAKWPMTYMEQVRATRSFKLNFLNQPVRADGDYWTPEDFAYGDVEAAKVLLQIDPAVTDKRNSDFHALAVVAYEPGRDGCLPRCAVRYARAYRMSPEKLRTKVLEILAAYPEIGAVRIEVNQGGQTWRAVLHDLPVRLLVHTESAPKTVRATWLLNHYQRGRVLHATRLPEVEEQMCAFPDVLNDDLVDAVGAAVRFFLDRPKVRAGATTTSYVKGAA